MYKFNTLASILATSESALCTALRWILPLLCISLLFTPAGLHAEEFSYQNYVVSASDVQGQLRGLFKQSTSLSLNQFLKKSKSERKKLSRGYHDEISFLEGLAYLNSKKTELAAQKFREAIANGYKNPIAKWKLSKVEIQLEEYQNALSLLKELAWLSKEAKHEIYFQMAETYKLSGKMDAYERFVDKALLEAPAYTPALEASIATKKERLSSIRDPKEHAALQARISDELLRLQQADPSNREASINLVRRLMSAGDPLVSGDRFQQAGQILRGLLESNSYRDVEVVRLLSELQLKQNKPEAASDTLAEGLKLSPGNEELLKMVKQVQIMEQSSALDNETP